MDPLSALREFTIRGELDKIIRVGDEFRFGNDYSFPCNAETAYRSKQGNLYTLESLLYYVNHSHVKHTDYLQNARTLKLQSVTLPDRKPLLEYLQGKLSSTDAIELLVPRDLNPKPWDFAAPADLACDAVEEYRPDDPGLGGTLSISTKRVRAEEASIGDEEPLRRIRVPEKVDYMGMLRVLEKPLKDREALLECRHRDFYGVLVASTKREEERQRIESQQRKDGLVAKSRLMGSEERGFWKDADDLGIDPAQSYFGRSKEIGKSKLLTKGSKIGEGVPIILVPSASQTLITIYNVKEFLEDGVFIPTDVKVKQMTNAKQAKPECVTVQKKISRDRVVAAYEVRDKPSVMKAEDWDRVVAVFVLGKEWQFKDWPFKDHVEIFNKIIGFYMRFEDDSVESAKTVKQWNVKIISISKNKRHQDRAAALEVWDRLEEFVRSRSHS